MTVRIVKELLFGSLKLPWVARWPWCRTADLIELDVEKRSLNMAVPDEELLRRRQAWTPPIPVVARGYAGLYVKHVLQADKGVDLDILVGGSGPEVYREPR